MRISDYIETKIVAKCTATADCGLTSESMTIIFDHLKTEHKRKLNMLNFPSYMDKVLTTGKYEYLTFEVKTKCIFKVLVDKGIAQVFQNCGHTKDKLTDALDHLETHDIELNTYDVSKWIQELLLPRNMGGIT